jgi:PAS domain S-box-containing protein
MSTRITRMELRCEQDVVSARSQAHIIAEQLGFDTIDQTRISTAVSEIARNVFQYAGRGEILFLIDTGRKPHVFTITVRDQGTGIPRHDEVPGDRSAAKTGMEHGIIISKRLMDHFSIDTRQGGSTICMGKNLPLTAREVTPTVLTGIATMLGKTASRNAFDEIRLQNQELIHVLNELHRKHEDLISINRELDDTNRGVVAVYAELDDKVISLARANEALARSEQRYRTLTEASPDQIVIDGSDGTIQYANTTALRLFRLPYDQVVGKPRKDLFPPDIFRLQDLALQKVFRTGESSRTEEIIPSGPEELWIDTHMVPLKDEAGAVSSVLSIARDITERKRDEEEIKKGATLLNDVGEMAQVGGWELDVATKEIRWTPETYRIHELAGDEKIDLPKSLLFYDLPGRSTMEAAVQHCIETEEPFDLDLPLTSAGGKHLWVRAMGHAVNTGGNVVKVTGTFQDITERKAADETIRTFGENLERQVMDRTADLSDSNLKLITEIGIRLDAEKRLTKNVGEKDALLREVHHRVKNNLQIIISLLNLQSRYMTDEVTLAAFRESQSRIKVMALVHEKLYQSTNLEKIDLDNFLKFLGSSLFQFYGVNGKGIRLTIESRDIFLAINTAIPLGLMINELITNSLKYAFPAGRTGEIFLAVHRQDTKLTVIYKDTGIGIPQDFDWRNAKSMGLRLIITLADQLDGTIELDRSSGTAFTIVMKENE